MRHLAPLPALLVSVVVTACTHNVEPKVTPAKISSVQPPITSRALLLIPASFEAYTSQSSSGIHRWNYHLGKSVAAALSDMVAQSFAGAETRRLADTELLRFLSAPGDTSQADVLLVPYFESGGTRERAFDAVAEARLRLDVRAGAGASGRKRLACGPQGRPREPVKRSQ